MSDNSDSGRIFKNVTALGDKIVAVWTYGCNDEGALGRNTASDTDEGAPGRVTLPRKAVAVTAGDSHSAALLENGDVYAWGSFRKSGSVYTMGCGEQGQLGRLSQRSASRDSRQGFSALLVPSKVTLKAGASRIWAGYHATFVLDSSQEKRQTALYAPTECDAFRQSSNWQRVAAGQHHSLALDQAGQVFAVGRCEYGSEGQLGTGKSEDANVPTPGVCVALGSHVPLSIAAGGQHTVLLVVSIRITT
ncbi:Bj1 protein [Operophtera brumata]|uniref:Bj1 protein n=1 Tax=Operophtera brumata TaxID=104452 RepID=A0A0L7LL18_OPEBR|nr:Bj1 protein [Operophtera brumata]